MWQPHFIMRIFANANVQYCHAKSKLGLQSLKLVIA